MPWHGQQMSSSSGRTSLRVNRWASSIGLRQEGQVAEAAMVSGDAAVVIRVSAMITAKVENANVASAFETRPKRV